MIKIQVIRKFRSFGSPISTEVIGYFDNISQAREFIKNIPYRTKSFTMICNGGKIKRYISYTCKKCVVQ